MAQFGRPSADTNNPGAYTDQAAGSTNIYLTIDETVASDADYIQSPLAPSSAVYVTKLSTVEDPVSSSGHVVRVRAAKSATGGAGINLTVQLRQGYVNEGTPGTLIATVMNAAALTDTQTTTTYNLSGGEADAITNYADLFLRFLSTQV
jgi:hypothetical protein